MLLFNRIFAKDVRCPKIVATIKLLFFFSNKKALLQPMQPFLARIRCSLSSISTHFAIFHQLIIFHPILMWLDIAVVIHSQKSTVFHASSSPLRLHLQLLPLLPSMPSQCILLLQLLSRSIDLSFALVGCVAHVPSAMLMRRRKGIRSVYLRVEI